MRSKIMFVGLLLLTLAVVLAPAVSACEGCGSGAGNACVKKADDADTTASKGKPCCAKGKDAKGEGCARKAGTAVAKGETAPEAATAATATAAAEGKVAGTTATAERAGCKKSDKGKGCCGKCGGKGQAAATETAEGAATQAKGETEGGTR